MVKNIYQVGTKKYSLSENRKNFLFAGIKVPLRLHTTKNTAD